MDTERSNHGIVLARGTVGGAPVAFVRERSSYNREVDATLTFVTISDPNRIHSIADLQHAFGDWFSFSFNWHLVDGDHMGWITTGRYPNLAPGVDPELPFWGDRDWDWQGFLPYEAHPQAVDPAAGFITNWNNKQAPGFRASDDWWAYGSVARKELLTDGVLAAMQDDGKVSLTELVQAMGLGATRDLRGAKVLPFILDVIGTPEDEQLADAVATLQLWTDSGANRRDLTGDGIYDDSAAVALMDALWEPVIQAIFEPELGASALTAIPLIHDDAPGAGGSAYFEGFYGQVQKDLRTILGEPVQGAFSRIYCGGGDSDACREVLTGALADAVDAVTAKYASADPTAWKVSARCDAGCDQIVFSAVGAVEERTMEWQNRPTFQQVLVFE
jgi:acyl-homoserine lactone acylase PvdQ